MYQIDFHTPLAVHFIGIGGISMSGLAEILLEEGFHISGSDAKESALTDALEKKAPGYITASGVPTSATLPTLSYTQRRSIRIIRSLPGQRNWGSPCSPEPNFWDRSCATMTLPSQWPEPTQDTTTSMLSHILLKGDCDPTISVGGILPAIGGNIRVGQSETFLTEACEYTNSFLSFFPKISIILNMDADHLDFFKDIDDIRRSFRRFAELLPADGTLIINADTPEYQSITEGLSCQVITYGLENNADYTASDITYDEFGHASFNVRYKGSDLGRCSLKVPGSHNVSNALSAVAAGRLLNLPWEVIAEGLLSFTGTDRRFQYKGTVGGVTIIDDYAHHPTEIEATLKAAANYPHRKVWCVFQPHTYTRTKALLPEFAQALTLADHVVLADIYAARETDTLGISSEDLADRIRELGTPCEYFPTFDEIENFLLENCTQGDLLITMGAGDVVNIGEQLLGR